MNCKDYSYVLFFPQPVLSDWLWGGTAECSGETGAGGRATGERDRGAAKAETKAAAETAALAEKL